MKQASVEVFHGADGRPARATAVARFDHAPAHVWGVIVDVERYPGRVPMIHRVRRRGDEVAVDLKFRISLLSVGFQFVVAATHEPERWLELRWISGEPRGLRLRFDLEPLDDGRACSVRTEASFDPHSLGWLAKYFLKNHPEIEFGIFPGVALALLDSMRRAAAEAAAPAAGKVA